MTYYEDLQSYTFQNAVGLVGKRNVNREESGFWKQCGMIMRNNLE